MLDIVKYINGELSDPDADRMTLTESGPVE